LDTSVDGPFVFSSGFFSYRGAWVWSFFGCSSEEEGMGVEEAVPDSND